MASVIVIEVARKKGPGWKVQWREGGGQRSQTFDTEQEANDFAAIKKGELVSGKSFDAQPGRMTFRTYWEDEYLPYYFPKLGIKTQPSYEGYANRLLLPYFGDRSLKDIRKSTLKDWVRWCQKGARNNYVPSAHSIKESFVVLRAVLTRAVNDERIQVNPCAGMTEILPTLPPKRKPVILSVPDVRALSEAVPSFYNTLILLLGTHGLRPSEALALTVGDVHVDEGYVWVCKAAVVVRGSMKVKPSTKSGQDRRVELFSFTKDALMEHMKELGELDDDTLLFPGKLSGKLFHMSYLRVLVNQAGEKLGFKALTTYDLKRSAATNLLKETKNIKWVQEQLGHSRYSMSLLYAQVTPGMSADANKIMTDAFNATDPTDEVNKTLQKIKEEYGDEDFSAALTGRVEPATR
jgi:integrase